MEGYGTPRGGANARNTRKMTFSLICCHRKRPTGVGQATQTTDRSGNSRGESKDGQQDRKYGEERRQRRHRQKAQTRTGSAQQQCPRRPEDGRDREKEEEKRRRHGGRSPQRPPKTKTTPMKTEITRPRKGPTRSGTATPPHITDPYGSGSTAIGRQAKSGTVRKVKKNASAQMVQPATSGTTTGGM